MRFAHFTENSSHEEGNIDRAIFSNNSFLDIKAATRIKYAEFNDTSEFRTSTDNYIGSYAPGVVYFKGGSSNKGYLYPDPTVVPHVKVIFQESSKNYGTIQGAGSKAFLGLSENHGYVENVYFRDQSKNYASGTSLQDVVPNWMVIRGAGEAVFRPTVVNAVFRGTTENLGNIDYQITFRDTSINRAITECINSTGVVFRDNSSNDAVAALRVSDATFYDSSINYGVIASKNSSLTNSGHATFHDNTQNNGVVEGRASFYENSINNTNYYGNARGIVCRSAKFFDTSKNYGAVFRNAYFSNSAQNGGAIGEGAYFTTEVNSYSANNSEIANSNNAKYIYLDGALTSCVYNGEQYVNGTNLKHGYYGDIFGLYYPSGFIFGTDYWNLEFFVKVTDNVGNMPCMTFNISRDPTVQASIYYSEISTSYKFYYQEGATSTEIGSLDESAVNKYIFIRIGIKNESGTKKFEGGILRSDGTMTSGKFNTNESYDIVSVVFPTYISNLRVIRGQFLPTSTYESVSPLTSPLTLDGTQDSSHSITGNVLAYDAVARRLTTTSLGQGFDVNGSPWTNTPGGVGRYWNSTTTTQPWSALNYWFTTSDCISTAKCLPDKDTEVELISGNIIANLDALFWIEPKNIKTNNNTITFTSNASNTVTCDITGNVTFSNSASSWNKTGVHWRPLLGTSTAIITGVSGLYAWQNTENWFVDSNTLNTASYPPVSTTDVYLHGTLNPKIDLDIESGKYRTPAKTIYTTASNRLIVNSTNNASLSCNVVGNIIFTGNASLASGYSHTFA